MENEYNLVEEDSSIWASINELPVDNNSDDESVRTDALTKIWDGNYVRLNLNAIYAILKIRDSTRQSQS